MSRSSTHARGLRFSRKSPARAHFNANASSAHMGGKEHLRFHGLLEAGRRPPSRRSRTCAQTHVTHYLLRHAIRHAMQHAMLYGMQGHMLYLLQVAPPPPRRVFLMHPHRGRRAYPITATAALRYGITPQTCCAAWRAATLRVVRKTLRENNAMQHATRNVQHATCTSKPSNRTQDTAPHFTAKAKRNTPRRGPHASSTRWTGSSPHARLRHGIDTR